jgi:uncharacterized protein
MMPRVEELLAGNPPPTTQEINNAFWQVCAGGQRRMAEHLLTRGADVNWIPCYAKITPLDAAGAADTRRDTLVTWLRERVRNQPRAKLRHRFRVDGRYIASS